MASGLRGRPSQINSRLPQGLADVACNAKSMAGSTISSNTAGHDAILSTTAPILLRRRSGRQDHARCSTHDRCLLRRAVLRTGALDTAVRTPSLPPTPHLGLSRSSRHEASRRVMVTKTHRSHSRCALLTAEATWAFGQGPALPRDNRDALRGRIRFALGRSPCCQQIRCLARGASS